MCNSNMSTLVSIIKKQGNILDDQNVIDLNADLRNDLDIDSLDLVEIIMGIEDKFNIEIDDSYIVSNADSIGIVTFGDLVKLLSTKYKIIFN